MRAGSCTLEQPLATEAASVVKQAVNLATRRGHAQVTPLHVANTMLSSSTGIFRTACLLCNSHPLQCKALELCFNVALNRLPASTCNPMLGHLSHHPSLSNALIAAFKRAQAQQRRGCIENQQQPVLDVKLEIEHLIISILDDPSVSRVMKEAGFSSIQVKHNVEQALSLEIGSQSSPAGSLGLSFSPDRNNAEASGWSLSEVGVDKQLTYCADYSSKYVTEPQNLLANSLDTTSSSSISKLPSWLQQYKDENRSLASPESNQTQKSRPSIVQLPKQTWSTQHSCVSNTSHEELNLRMYTPESRVPNPVLFSKLNPNIMPYSTCPGEEMEMDYFKRFKELNAENFKTLCNDLEQKVPWQKDVIPQIASTILQCRSGMITRKEKMADTEPKEETWFFFQGKDVEGKERIARELANLVFGSEKSFHSVSLSSFSSPRSDSMEDSRNKRLRNELSCCYLDRLAEAIQGDPHRVFFVEDIEQVDYCSQLGFKRAIERGTIMKCNEDEVCLSDAIIILTCESFSSKSRACSPTVKLKLDEITQEDGDGLDEETDSCVSLDLNLSAEEDNVNDESIDDIGLLEAVDEQIHFNLPDC